jgi:hypothetical protein
MFYNKNRMIGGLDMYIKIKKAVIKISICLIFIIFFFSNVISKLPNFLFSNHFIDNYKQKIEMLHLDVDMDAFSVTISYKKFFVLNLPYVAFQTLGSIYDRYQDRNFEMTTIDIEVFKELVNRNQVRQAKNAVFHNINDCNNFKYLSRNGKYEYIVKVEIDEDGSISYVSMVKDPINRGTYNLFNQEGKWFERKGHIIDVYLWLLYGTGKDDQSSFSERFSILRNRPTFCPSN